ncbi:UDP-N-acetylmuramate--L-alanine ligase [Thermincola ferriacetica]|uniref:UDP-N-acetylmuramate--L-alanine ligase n=1 Tax=Thermincola ferriacetica TaxID=281456 RepID=A0A0L6W4M2_9FIRM|nr:UDP-N-acetylmuramate--L-alanine ligase [Thermincola ferriacetica]KNZ70470.1 UDP-N-acetylmuramate--L-alanine ligase [Thermincola ferriacetica]
MGKDQTQFHFIGIGGAGMSGLARILLQKGMRVSGSDIKSSRTFSQLKELGAKVYLGHSRENISEEIRVVVVSSAISPDNEELAEARKKGLKILHRGDVLAGLMAEKKGIAVAGAHGKTTTTSMIALVLEKNGLDPTVVVGGELFDIGSNAKLGKGEYLVAEADESDGSFLKLSPYIEVITNIEDDHLDYYGSTEKIDAAFQEFTEKIPDEGFCILCFNSPKVKVLADKLKKPFISYGIGVPAEYEGRNVLCQGTQSSVDVFYRNEYLGKLRLNVPGEHNLANALAALAVGRLVGLSFEQVADALASFTGVGRRFQLIGQVKGITVVDDYAHHPTELKATLQAAQKAGFTRIISVFQPHRFTRTKFLYRQFGEAFHGPDIIIITEIYSAGEKPIAGVSAQLIIDEVKKHTTAPVYFLKTEEDILEFLLANTRSGDLVLTLGAGNIWAVGVELVRRLKEGK